jgi:hypothetical protein
MNEPDVKKCIFIVYLLFIFIKSGYSQELQKNGAQILFHGFIMDAKTQTPLAGSQITINRSFSSISGDDGKFAFNVSRNDTVIFSRLGYKSTILLVSDTLTGKEYVAGIYMHSDTLLIGEVIIIPRFTNLKSELLNSRTGLNPEMENARYNLEISAFQGRITQNKLGDPEVNYEYLRQKQKINAYEKGGIPSERIVGISPFLLIPAAYLLIHGLPEKPAPLQPRLSDQDVNQIHKKYLETLKKRK